ncbi:MAG: hypothetical protein ABI440_10960 [Casimicrobiaceae bacterium]
MGDVVILPSVRNRRGATHASPSRDQRCAVAIIAIVNISGERVNAVLRKSRRHPLRIYPVTAITVLHVFSTCFII